jgi:hypothetical protein
LVEIQACGTPLSGSLDQTVLSIDDARPTELIELMSRSLVTSSRLARLGAVRYFARLSASERPLRSRSLSVPSSSTDTEHAPLYSELFQGVMSSRLRPMCRRVSMVLHEGL